MGAKTSKTGKLFSASRESGFEFLLPPYGPHQFRWVIVFICIGLFFVVLNSKTTPVAKKRTDIRNTKIDISILVEDRISRSEPRTDLAKFELQYGCYLGAYIDLSTDIQQGFVDMTGKTRKYPDEFETKVGKQHAMYFFYLGYGRELPLDWVRYLTSKGKIVHIALEPNDGLDAVQENDYLNQLADDIRISGAIVFLRFASEMNGSWVKYNGNPELYKEKWRLIANVMRERAPNVAMVWCPYAAPLSPISDYYPGDEFVDWVGVNMYSVTYQNQDQNLPASHIKPADLLSGIYNIYSNRKPIMICEYGTTHYSAVENEYQQGFAISNLLSLYDNLKTDYPKVKAINYFNVNNMSLDHRMNNNYSVTDDPDVLECYKKVIEDSYFISSFFGNEVGGELKLPKPLIAGSTISGRQRFLIYMQNAKPVDKLQIKMDDNIIRRGDGVRQWSMTLDFDTFEPGKHVLKFESVSSSGDIAAQKLVPITIERSGLSK